MAIIKCKMCGGDMELAADKTFGTCEFCGSTMTLPKVDDEQRAALFNRGNHFRRIGEFDKALSVYEQIIREDDTDAEAHWCCALCRFGIEYVEDPATYEYLPTCHRASFDSFLEDVDYKAALEYSDGITRRQYVKDAAKIADVQRGILATSQNAEPYDVFICYKESDDNGGRTRDSLLAQEIYYQLTEQGRKVFFSRITLEDVAGTQYEPYIFAALNSAKVMIVVGTKPEHLSAVWVKNEWSRFLAMMKKDRSKLLLPCYRDMDPYDMPEALSVLQSYDMSKIGFIQDLTRGIAKVLDAQKKPITVKETVVKETVVTSANISTAPLLKRAFMFLEDGDWDSADEYCEKVLDMDPECAEAYLGKLMVELRVKKRESLRDCAQPFDDRNDYKKAIRFADKELKAALSGYVEHINIRNENTRVEGIYNRARNLMAAKMSESAYKEAARIFETIRAYKDSAELAQKCYEKAEAARKDAILVAAKTKMTFEEIFACEAAIELLESIRGWKDADEQIILCRKKIEAIKAKKEADRIEKERKAELARIEAERIAKKKKKIAIIATSIICAVIAFVIVLNTVIIPYVKYNDAIELMDAGNVVDAYETLIALGSYKDSADKANSIYHKYKFEKMLEKLKGAKVGDYVFFGAYEQDNNITNGKEDIEWLVLEVKDGKVLLISQYALDCKQYNTSYTDVTWETCTLRKWLNEDFINSTFTADEKAMIPAVTLSADENSKYSTNHSKATQDQVFLLSVTEANQYFSSDDARQCKPTDYAVENGAGFDSFNGNCMWWLRSLGDIQHIAAIVNRGVYGYMDVDVSSNAVRPAIWVDISGTEGMTSAGWFEADGTVVATGENTSGQCNVTNWTDIVAISAGVDHTIGLKADGTVVAVGSNRNGQCNVSGWKNIKVPGK